MSRHPAEKILRGRSSLEGERRTVTALLADGLNIIDGVAASPEDT